MVVDFGKKKLKEKSIFLLGQRHEKSTRSNQSVVVCFLRKHYSCGITQVTKKTRKCVEGGEMKIGDLKKHFGRWKYTYYIIAVPTFMTLGIFTVRFRFI